MRIGKDTVVFVGHSSRITHRFPEVASMPENELEKLSQAVDEIWKVGKTPPPAPSRTPLGGVPATIMYEVGSYGLPGRFSHWTHGRAYHQMKTMYDFGLSKIYELVINTDPCYAFLMEANSPLENKLVVAHVLAHCDFFRHNAYFA